MIIRRDAETGLYYRPPDKVIVDEVRGVYRDLPIRSSDVVLDLGAHIGATSLLALRKGARRVVAVEADPGNISLLRRNIGTRATVLWGAVTDEGGLASFYVRTDGRSYLGSVLADPDRRPMDVPAIPLDGLLAKYRPTVVKCDIEFGEYGLPALRSLPRHVRVLALEVHIRYAGIFTGRPQSLEDIARRRIAAAELIAAVEDQGFREVRRKDKQARASEPEALPDATGFPPLTKAVDAIWERS